MEPQETPSTGQALKAGLALAGRRFLLKRVLGQGGMGVVWQAHDVRLGEALALKFLPPEVAHDSAALNSLRRETLRTRKLSHPNIVRIYDFVETEGEPPFISMEYVDGPNLHDLRERRPLRVLKWDYLAPLVRQLCLALDYAHGEKLVHRDLKPANLMVDASGRLKLADFGLACVMHDSLTRLTRVAPAAGTLVFMSPQQADGKAAQVSDDIYSLGATIYELLTSTPPFYQGDVAFQMRHTRAEPIAQRLLELGVTNEVPSSISALILACLAKEPEQRPGSAKAILDFLEAAEKGEAAALPGAEVTEIVETAPGGSGVVMAQEVSEETPLTENEPSLPVEPNLTLRQSSDNAPQGAPTAEGVQASEMGVAVGEPKRSNVPLWAALVILVVLAAGYLGMYLGQRSKGEKVIGNPISSNPLAPQAIEKKAPPSNPPPAIAKPETPPTQPAVPRPKPAQILVAPTAVRLEKGVSKPSEPSAPWPGWLPQFYHTGPVYGLSFSPEDEALASAGQDGTIRLWLTNGMIGPVLRGHSDAVFAVAFVPGNPRQLASGSADRTIKFWDRASSTCITSLAAHQGGVRALVFSSDGKSLFSGGEDNLIIKWDVASKRLLGRQGGHVGAVLCMSASPDGRWFASGGADGKVRLWDLRTGQLVKTFEKHTRPVLSLSFSGDSRVLASTAGDPQILFWDVQTRELITSTTFSMAIRSLRMLHKSSTVIIGCEDQVLRWYDMVDGKTGITVVDLGWPISFAVSSKGRVASGCRNGWVNRRALAGE